MKEQILTKEQITKAFAYANFGESSREDVIKYSLLKYASGYSTGRTAKVILIELGLLSVNEKLTVKGKRYLFWTTDEVIERMKEKDNEIKRLENLLTAESKESTERFKRIIELQNIIEKIEHTK